MAPWPARNSFDILVIGKRLAVLLLAVAAYYVVAGLVIQSFQLQVIRRGSAGSLTNTLLLGLLLSVCNQALCTLVGGSRAVGQLANDCRHLAAKCAAFAGHNQC
jgi:hypothetical protein